MKIQGLEELECWREASAAKDSLSRVDLPFPGLFQLAAHLSNTLYPWGDFPWGHPRNQEEVDDRELPHLADPLATRFPISAARPLHTSSPPKGLPLSALAHLASHPVKTLYLGKMCQGERAFFAWADLWVQ
jgi:hypothetical protein